MPEPVRLQKAAPEDQEANFRRDLENVVELMEKLSPFCSAPEVVAELAALANLALTNDSQLRILIATVSKSR